MFFLRNFCLVVIQCIVPLITWANPLGKTNIKYALLQSTDSEFNLFEEDIAGINSFDFLAGQEPRNAIVYEELLWPNGIVYYSIADNFTATELGIISQAINEYETKSCIRFVPRTNEPDYIYIEKTGAGCYSYIGRIGVAQTVSLDDNCFNGGLPGTAIHELLHAVGFFHEQSRTDRDDYVIINYSNVQPGSEANFLSYGPDVIQYLGASYDYDSVMHYGAYSFAKDPNIPTIITRKPDVEIGQRRGFSEVDIFKLNALYKCSVTSKEESPAFYVRWDQDVKHV